MQGIFRSAYRAGHRLRMKAAVAHIGVFFAAVVAHDKFAHRSLVAVVWKVFDDSEAWPAVGAVDERIVDAVWLCFHVAQTIVTHCNIRTDLSYTIRHRIAFHNLKIRKFNKLSLTSLD
ncbi:hypothetical protein DSECCO2_544350 [anaerobic digester metagenome]